MSRVTTRRNQRGGGVSCRNVYVHTVITWNKDKNGIERAVDLGRSTRSMDALALRFSRWRRDARPTRHTTTGRPRELGCVRSTHVRRNKRASDDDDDDDDGVDDHGVSVRRAKRGHWRSKASRDGGVRATGLGVRGERGTPGIV